MTQTTPILPFFDPESETKRLTEFIHRTMTSLKLEGGVIGLSGGIDSSVCAGLMVRTLGSNKVLGVAIPSLDSDPSDEKDAKAVAEYLDIEYIVHPLVRLMDQFGVYDYIEKMGDKEEIKQKYYIKATEPMTRSIAYPCVMKLRGRMLVLSHYAFQRNYFQCQTIDKTEWEVGFFDKFGDVVGDIAPIWHLYKTHVIELGRYLGLPEVTINRAPGSGNFPVTDEEELGLTIEETDTVLHLLELGHLPHYIDRKTGIPAMDVMRIRDLVSNSGLKREIPIAVDTYE